MADVLQMLLQFLNVNCGIVNCYYANIFEGLFYLILLPSFLLILFIYFLAGAVLGKLGGPSYLNMVLSIIIYIFIIIEGWYTIFISLGQVWIILVIVVGIIFFGLRHLRGGGAPSVPTGGGMPGILKYGVEKAKEAGGRTGVEKEISDRISNMRAIIGQMRNPSPGTDVGVVIGRYWQFKQAAESAIKSLEQLVGWPASKAITKKYWDEISKLTNEFEKLEKEARERGAGGAGKAA